MKEKLSKIAISNQANKSLSSMLEALNKRLLLKLKNKLSLLLLLKAMKNSTLKKYQQN